jgi:DNA-binding CsgD family transcriptional regulator
VEPNAVELIGREEELGSLEVFLAEVLAGPAALVVSGEPGIGKTAFLETALDEAQARCPSVLLCRGLQAEVGFAFAGLSELFAGALGDVARLLPSPRRRALEIALLLAEPEDDPPQAHAVGLAILDALRELEKRGPLLVAVDDLQWLDSSTAAALQIALRRLRSERIGVLATLREAEGVEVPLELERAFPEGRLTRLALSPLGVGALHRLLKSRLGLELARLELARVREASGGNPLFALELGRELVRSGAKLEPGKPLPVPDSLGKLLRARLAQLPVETVEILLIAAAAGNATTQTIATAYGSAEHVLAALAPAERDGVVKVGRSVHFSHPLFASVCYELASEAQRRAAHQALADATADLEEHARHLALAAVEPNAGVAAALDEAVTRAAGRGAPAAAAEFSELAASLTPFRDAARRRRRRLRAAELHNLGGNPERAASLYTQLLGEVDGGAERADALIGLASTRLSDPSTFARLLDDALSEAAGDDSRSARILGFRAQVAFVYGGPRAGAADARAAFAHAERAGEPLPLAVAIAHLGQLETYTLDVTPGLLERGVAIEEALGRPLDFFSSPSAMHAVHLFLNDDLDRARALLEDAGVRAAERGAEVERAWVHFYLMWLEWLAGRWQAALGHIAEAKELAGQAQDEFLGPQLVGQEAFIESRLGRIEEARAKAESVLVVFSDASSEIHRIVCVSTLGHIELALGNLEAANRYLHDLPGQLLSCGWLEPGHPLWPDAIETLVGVGKLDQARAYLDQHERLAGRAGRLARGYAARCRGLLAAAEGDLAAAFEAFERGLAEQGNLYPFERGRTLLALGSARRQAKQKRLAREALEQALALFEELGARLWAEKARAELRRISGRRPGAAGLTETEERVARLAAQGHANKQIAAALFISVHTVEAHLTHVYRKLEIQSRGQLATRITTTANQATALVADDDVRR